MISVIIPAYNAQEHIGNCIKALQAQDFNSESYEIIVVDDGSQDKTAEVAQELGARLIKKSHGGPAAARNAGASSARGDLIVFTDADCIPTETWLSALITPFSDDTIVGVMGRYLTRQQSITARFAQAEFEDRYRRMAKLKYIDLVATYSAAFRKDVFLAEGGFNTLFPRADNEDVEFSYRLASKGHRLKFVADAAVYHTHPGALLQYLHQKLNRALWRLIVYTYHPGKALKDTYTPLSLKIQIVLSWCIVASLVLAIWQPFLLLPTCVLFSFFCLSCLTFSKTVWHDDKLIAMLGPGYIFLRSLTFGLGLVIGLIKVLKLRKKNL